MGKNKHINKTRWILTKCPLCGKPCSGSSGCTTQVCRDCTIKKMDKKYKNKEPYTY